MLDPRVRITFCEWVKNHFNFILRPRFIPENPLPMVLSRVGWGSSENLFYFGKGYVLQLAVVRPDLKYLPPFIKTIYDVMTQIGSIGAFGSRYIFFGIIRFPPSLLDICYITCFCWKIAVDNFTLLGK